MLNLPPDVAMQLLIGLVSAAAIYGGIRADLKSMHTRLTMAEKGIDDERKRLDNHIERTHS